MSIHGCNELCDIDPKFHAIQRWEGDFPGETTTIEGMKEWLTKEISKLVQLLEKLNGHDRN